ncbi:hypothetical protein HU200_005554 [Digitaria exilis]|uniref:Glutaredoxin domain-containing protein n=1 Tax=Digitaria exilis TaxID=1010633 RepID=A0A835KU44_9POAL|nr:hypothetical protein HU200_005554 [Digitaria exilis]CAB3470080.1 unnamed protein product [Digitaria exilis]
MGCQGSKHALHGGCGGAPPEPRGLSGRLPPRWRRSVAARSAALGTLSLDRAAAAVAAMGVSFDDAAYGGGEGMVMNKAGDNEDADDGVGKLLGPSRSFAGWRPATPPPVAAPPKKRPKKQAVVAAPASVVAPRTPTKTPARGPPEEINVWELMNGLDDDEEEEGHEREEVEEDKDDRVVHGEERRKAQSATGSPVFDPEILDAFRKALDELTHDDDSPPLPPDFVKRGDDVVEKREIQKFPGIVRARVTVLQEKIDAKTKLAAAAAKKQASPAPPPESAGRVVVYLTSLRGIRHTYEDCWSTAAVLRGYGARVDERDLSMHAGFKDELRAALACGGDGRVPPLPQVFVDGRHLGGAEEVRRLHEAGELAAALEGCDAVVAKGCAGEVQYACGGCGGMRFVPCDACSGSCKVFVEDDVEGGAGSGAGAFRRCPECNENGLVRCPVC